MKQASFSVVCGHSNKVSIFVGKLVCVADNRKGFADVVRSVFCLSILLNGPIRKISLHLLNPEVALVNGSDLALCWPFRLFSFFSWMLVTAGYCHPGQPSKALSALVVALLTNSSLAEQQHDFVCGTSGADCHTSIFNACLNKILCYILSSSLEWHAHSLSRVIPAEFECALLKMWS